MINYDTKMAINVPAKEEVLMVNMGECQILDDTKRQHLLTYGLGPCVGVSIVITYNSGKIARFLAHVDMGQVVGISFKTLSKYIDTMRNNSNEEIKNVTIELTSTQSYCNTNQLDENEKKLLLIILNEFNDLKITYKNIKFNKSSQVQISPEGIISTFTEQEINEHKNHLMMEDLANVNGYVEPTLNIYITMFGAWMGNCSLSINCTEEEKYQLLNSNYWQSFATQGYKLTVAPSFNNPDSMAIYLENWNDKRIQKYGTIPGCMQAMQQNIQSKHL